MLQVLVDRSRLSAAAEAELRVAVSSFADTVGIILQRCVADCADADAAASVPSDSSNDRKSHFSMWLEHFGAFQVDHTSAAPKQIDSVATAQADVAPATAPTGGVVTTTTPHPTEAAVAAAAAVAATTTAAAAADDDDTAPSVVSSSQASEAAARTSLASLDDYNSESPPAKRARAAALLSDIDAFLAAQACVPDVETPSSPCFNTSGGANAVKDRQKATPGTSKRRSKTGSVHNSAGHSRYMGYGYEPSPAASEQSGAATIGSCTTGVSVEVKGTRHCTHEPQFVCKPGQLSPALREALGMTGTQTPPYLERMRKLGWPPGWTSQRYNQSLRVWEVVPSIATTCFPGLAWSRTLDAEATHPV